MVVLPGAHPVVAVYTIDGSNPDIPVFVFANGIDSVMGQAVIYSYISEFLLFMNIVIDLQPTFGWNKKQLKDYKGIKYFFA